MAQGIGGYAQTALLPVGLDAAGPRGFLKGGPGLGGEDRGVGPGIGAMNQQLSDCRHGGSRKG
ncbi:hypothetical protein SDC9_141946 [bioreactor metagenome]|uniref:Uncharacterized protein n=1 Tax=bioreactor metagenome TaxID=1076179 RepID=A0A645E098_9ZZZZ